MKTSRTIYHLIVDKSGSMSDCIENTINGFNEQLHMIRNLQREHPNQEILIGLTSFNERIDHILMNVAADKPQPLSPKTYRPNGTTALLDAIGQTTGRLEEWINSRSDIPTTAVIVIITDGYENSSQYFTLEQIRSQIKRLEETGKWTFSFIGATLDAVNTARELAIKENNSYSFSKNEMKTAVWDKLSRSMANYMTKKQSGSSLGELFDEEK